MKTKLAALLISVLSLTALAACNSNQNSSSEVGFAKTEERTAAYQAVSTLNMLGTIQTTSNIMKSNAILTSEEVPPSDTEVDGSHIIDIINQADIFISSRRDSLETTEGASDIEGYTTKQVITYTDFDETRKTIELHFNTTTFTDEDDDHDDDHDHDEERHHHRYGLNFDDKNEQEIKTLNEGILIEGENTYDFVSFKVEETDTDESEAKMEMRIFTAPNSYVLCEHVFETETEWGQEEVEEEYRYKVVQDGTIISDYYYEIETEDNEMEVKLRISDKIYRLENFFRDGKEYLKAVEIDHSNFEKNVYFFEKIIDENGNVSYIPVTL